MALFQRNKATLLTFLRNLIEGKAYYLNVPDCVKESTLFGLLLEEKAISFKKKRMSLKNSGGENNLCAASGKARRKLLQQWIEEIEGITP